MGALVICVGNPLRGDDGVGWRAAELLERALGDTAEVVVRHQLTPELAEHVARADVFVVVDASVEVPAGRVATSSVEIPTNDDAALTHDLSPGALLALARTVFGRSPSCISVVAGAERFDYEERLSPAVETALPEIVAAVVAVVRPAEP
jgi:hydrogenase maturation protease